MEVGSAGNIRKWLEKKICATSMERKRKFGTSKENRIYVRLRERKIVYLGAFR
jgi:hypothetical protein